MGVSALLSRFRLHACWLVGEISPTHDVPDCESRYLRVALAGESSSTHDWRGCAGRCQKAAWRVHKGTSSLTFGLTASRCQKSAWKEHKGTCGKEELTLLQVWERVLLALNAKDWQGVLAWEGRATALVLDAGDDEERAQILDVFAHAHMKTGNGARAAAYLERKVAPLPC